MFGGGKSNNLKPTNPAVGPAPAVSAQPTGGDAKDKAILDMIASVEAAKADPYGGFNTSAGATAGRATEKTIDWLARNANGAIGRHQHVGYGYGHGLDDVVLLLLALTVLQPSSLQKFRIRSPPLP